MQPVIRTYGSCARVSDAGRAPKLVGFLLDFGRASSTGRGQAQACWAHCVGQGRLLWIIIKPGNRNPQVLPLPVFAMATRSLPCKGNRPCLCLDGRGSLVASFPDLLQANDKNDSAFLRDQMLRLHRRPGDLHGASGPSIGPPGRSNSVCMTVVWQLLPAAPMQWGLSTPAQLPRGGRV